MQEATNAAVVEEEVDSRIKNGREAGEDQLQGVISPKIPISNDWMPGIRAGWKTNQTVGSTGPLRREDL